MKLGEFAFFLILISSVLMLPIAVFIGYADTIACSIALIGFMAFLIISRNEIYDVLSKRINRYSLLCLVIILAFFILFSIFFLKKTELIFFDENIYQSEALGIISHGSGLICWYGTAHVNKCFLSQLGFDPAGWPFTIAIAFELFGSSLSTSYNLELLIGALSILSVFLVSSLLTNRKEVAILSAAVFSLTPMLFVWSKTLANPSLPFMMFATLTSFFFMLFIKKPSKNTVALLAFSLILTIYMRIEAILLVPIFIICFFAFGNSSLEKNIKERSKLLKETAKRPSSKRYLMILIAMFILLIEPELYVLVSTGPEVHANAVFYLGPNVTNFSFSNFASNIGINLSYLLGLIEKYPIIFLPNLTILGFLGAAFLLLRKDYQDRTAILSFLLLFFLGYFIFYDFYWAGSVLAGTSVRFMLILCPPLAILSAFGIQGLGDTLLNGLRRTKRAFLERKTRYAVYIVLTLLIFAAPFYGSIPFLTNPNYNYEGYPTLNNIPQSNPYQMIYPNRSLSFIYKNYQLVPSSCLVFSELPYVWYDLNRSSAIPQVANSSYPTGNYSCYAFDYDWWCTIKPYNTTICNPFLSRYKLKVLATESSGIGNTNYTIYQIMNYTPN